MPGMDQMKTAGAHLNPAFLQEMAQNGSGDASKGAPQNMVCLCAVQYGHVPNL